MICSLYVYSFGQENTSKTKLFETIKNQLNVFQKDEIKTCFHENDLQI